MQTAKSKRIFVLTLIAALAAVSLAMTLLGVWDSIYRAAGYRENINDSNMLTVTFLDVGAADCCVLSCGGKTVLIDAGDNLGKNSCINYLKKNGIEKIDLAILSHFDSDHCEELGHIAENVSVEKLVLSSAFDAGAAIEAIGSVQDAGAETEYKKTGDVLKVGELKIEVLSPAGDEYNSDNDNSLVVKVEEFGKTLLFTGDAGEDVERTLLDSGKDLSCDILKVSHHGSKTGSCSEFIDSAKPKYAVVSVGKNYYGLPSKRVIKRFEEAGADVLRTDENGNITFEITRDKIDLRTDY